MYLEYSLIENLIINYCIISLTYKILNQECKLKFLGIFIMTGIYLVTPFFSLTIVEKIVIEALSLILVSIICSKIKMEAISFLIVSLLDIIFKIPVHFIGNIWIKFAVILFLYLIIKLVCFRLLKNKTINNFLTGVSIIDNGVEIETKGYFDSGNLLYDPVTHQPICLISYEVFSELYDTDMVKIFLKKIDVNTLKNGHYIDVDSAVGEGKMLVFNIDEMIIHNRGEDIVFKNQCVGLSMKFEKPMNSKVLLHSSNI